MEINETETRYGKYDTAICEGEIRFSMDSPIDDIMDKLFSAFPDSCVHLCEEAPGYFRVFIDSYEFDECCIDDALRFITPYTLTGEINVCGESVTIWRYFFTEMRFWVSQYGTVIYQEAGTPILTDEMALNWCGGVDYDDD